MCDGINDVVKILTQHVDFWSDLSARITIQLVELTPDKLIKNNGKIRIGNVEQSEEEWGEVEALYQQYASTVSPPRRLSAITVSINDFVLHRHGFPSHLICEYLIGSILCG